MSFCPAPTEQQKQETPQDSGEKVTRAIRKIEPCIGVWYDDGSNAPGIFHLLHCGHVVAIDSQDTRCARNCRYPINPINPRFSDTVVKSTSHPLNFPGPLPSIHTAARPDYIYCEVCHGLPVDHYHSQKPATEFPQLSPRRSLALTRGEIVAALQIPDDQVETLLAAPFPKPGLQEHSLQCGHKVWCVAPQPCCQNCLFEKPCVGDPISIHLQRDPGVIFCQECVLRAERLYTRYEAKEKELELRREGYPGPGAEFGF